MRKSTCTAPCQTGLFKVRLEYVSSPAEPFDSQSSSQISSWSQENDIHSLSSINKAMDILGHGKISPIKFQVRTNIEDLKPSTLRYLKRKATTTVHEALDCIAPSQAKKLLQLLHIDKVSSFEKGIEIELSGDVLQIPEVHRTYVHTIESAKQDWYNVTSVVDHSLKTIKDQMPNIKSVVLRSDNAGCYHCSNLWHSLHGISQRTVKLRTENHFVIQDCTYERKMRKYVLEGGDITSSTEMKEVMNVCGVCVRLGNFKCYH
ncbi:unnamed protein product [Mytilus edulis]|uniref:Uncharacterized protein n=1 Tax=Mytilus edulis TaxID=6550 RepID=A0A8S3QZW5_MYTED|nr:unnamed protein product [Mytilus edulis]